MNSRLSRFLVALPLTIVLSLCMGLLGWSNGNEFQNSAVFNTGILYVVVIFSMMAVFNLIKIIKSDQIDHNQIKLDLIFSAIQLTESKTPLIEEIEQEDIEFDYTKIAPQRIPSPNVDRSLEF